MGQDVMAYFKGQYAKANFSVVPGEWPDFKSKSEVDTWIKDSERQLEILINYKKIKNNSLRT